MISSLRFLLDYENIQDDDDSDAESSDDDDSKSASQVVINREAVYKATNKGTSSSKKKKQAKLQRAMRSIKKKQRAASENTTSTYSPLNHLNDPQKFAEKLLSRLQAGKSIGKSNDRVETRLMMIKVIARAIGLHKLQLLSFYQYLQNYAKSHEKDVTQILAAAVQACHDGVPSDAVQPLFKQIVNQFVHDGSQPEAVAVGINVVREMCLRIPDLMTEELLQDLAEYKKKSEKAVSAAARSLIALFREINPLLLVKKDRGRPGGSVSKPKQYGESNVFSNVPNVELLQESVHESDEDDDDVELPGSDDVEEELMSDDSGTDVEAEEDSDDDVNNTEDDSDIDTSIGDDEEGETNDSEDIELDSEDEEVESDEGDDEEASSGDEEKAKGKKRKMVDFDANLLSADTSLRALKRFAEAKSEQLTVDESDGILSNEDFRKIKELQAKKEAKLALARKGFKVPDSEQLSKKKMDPAKLEAHIRHKLTKEQRLELVKAGREDREKYKSRTAVKQKKKGGLSNKQKEHKKNMPLAAIRSKAGKSKRIKKMKNKISGSQFRGRKAWK